MFSLRKLQEIFNKPADEVTLDDKLTACDVPITSTNCRSCSNPCDQGHDEYPSRFDVDTTSQMLGTVKPYRRQILISTGRSDWDREVTETPHSLAAHVLSARQSAQSESTTTSDDKATESPIFQPTDSNRISILNASHHSMSCNENNETVIVFPDYKFVTEVHRSPEGAQIIWNNVVNPAVDRTGVPREKSPLKSWVLPYACVILLCSHKTRDNRCSIAAPKLEHGFTQYLGVHGWHVDTEIDASIGHETALEDWDLSGEELDQRFNEKLKESSESKRALILRISHIGGHRYAGNCIIYSPQGSAVWYGRVSPHEVECIVTNTIIEGFVVPSLLRGGLNLSRPGHKTLYDW
ncbi:hypothetical protein AX15_001286 [Amanita polypyramis BW_CC]|nr:hypothetical protein AX15_001286 [Amanita polypyramis BW_CC]